MTGFLVDGRLLGNEDLVGGVSLFCRGFLLLFWSFLAGGRFLVAGFECPLVGKTRRRDGGLGVSGSLLAARRPLDARSLLAARSLFTCGSPNVGFTFRRLLAC